MNAAALCTFPAPGRIYCVRGLLGHCRYCGKAVSMTPPVVMYGKVTEDKDKLFFDIGVGDAEDDEGTQYTLTVSATSFVPRVHCVRTGRTFSLSWQDIIALAKLAGVDKEPS